TRKPQCRGSMIYKVKISWFERILILINRKLVRNTSAYRGRFTGIPATHDCIIEDECTKTGQGIQIILNGPSDLLKVGFCGRLTGIPGPDIVATCTTQA